MHPLVNTSERPLSQKEEALLAELESVIKEHLKRFVTVGLALKEIRDQRLYRINYPIFEDYLLREWDMTKQHGYRLIEAAEVYVNLKGLLEETLLNPKKINLIPTELFPEMGEINLVAADEPEKVSNWTLSVNEKVTNWLLPEGPDISEQLDNLLPKNEAQARPLTLYIPEKQREIWLQVLDKASATGARITANFIIQVILEIERKAINDRVKKHADRTNKTVELPPLVKTTYQALLQVVVSQNNEDWKAVGKPTMISLLEDLLETLRQ